MPFHKPDRLYRPLCLFACLALLLLASTASLAQSAPYTPAPEDAGLLKQLTDKYEKQHKQELSALPSTNKKDFEKIYQQRWDYIKEKFDKKEIYTDPVAQGYLDQLTAEIVKGNPLLKEGSFRCYFSRSGVPNASYIGEGIILVNMGLFYRLRNEDEAAFVVAHEIAHFQLKHPERAINRYVTTLNSPEIQEELRKIKNTDYRKRNMVEQLVKGITFNSRRHSRDHESEADSMAIELMRNTRFALSGAITTLQLLDKVDSDSFNTATCLEKLFNAPGYPFQQKWIAKEEGLLGGHAVLKSDDTMEDSLKTHPDCQLRIKALEPMISRYSQGNNKPVTLSASFTSLSNQFPYEVIAYYFNADNYTASFYRSLVMIQQKPGDAWLIAHIGKLLNSFYAAQKAHTFGRYVQMPAPDYPENYNLLLQFVQNLYSENFASISYHFLKQYHPQFDSYEPFKTVYSNSIMIAKK